ncbi:hypothetical protein ACFXKG_07120 [Streptomyces sp. NPDC059255]|uniref:hypothetical protein n=1 Tax=Streptomyces sp. NPDC059255 TaxID=3346793 RepID=UPI00367569B2
MLILTAPARTVTGSAARAAAFTALTSATAAGLHHATADSPVSWPSLALAALVMFAGAAPAFHFGTPRAVVAVVVLVQAVLPTWLNATETAVTRDGHHRLPPVWHHSSPAMAALNLTAGLALAWLLHSACALPSQLFHAWTEPARQWAVRLAKALSVQLPQPYEPSTPHPGLLAPPALSSQTAHLTLRHQRVPCGP